MAIIVLIALFLIFHTIRVAMREVYNDDNSLLNSTIVKSTSGLGRTPAVLTCSREDKRQKKNYRR